MNNRIIEYLKQNWQRNYSKISSTTPSEIHFLQLSQSHTKDYEKGRIILLIFLEHLQKPSLVAKYTRDKSYEDDLQKEIENSQNINRLLRNKLFPEVYEKAQIGPKQVVFEEYIDGVSINAELRNRVLEANADIKVLTEEYFSLVSQILDNLNRKRGKVKDKKDIKKEISKSLSKLKKTVDLNENISKRIEQSADFISRSKTTLYKGIINYDFVPANILKAREGNRIIDLEFARESTLSFLEPCRFIYYYVDLLTDLGVFKIKDFPTNLGFLCFDKKHWLGVLIKKYFGKYLDFHLLSDYFLICLVEDTLLRAKVEKFSTKHRQSIFDNTVKSLTEYRAYLIQVVARQDEDISHLKNNMVSTEEKDSNYKKQIQQLKGQISIITNSKGWQMLEKFRAIKRRFFP